MPVLPWLHAPAARLAAAVTRGRTPSALLIHGPRGVGREILALWFAALVLGRRPGREPPTAGTVHGHPDFRAVRIEEEKSVISVTQIRDLIAFFGLTSHQGGTKVALILPAEAMTVAAANSLLKTLEEPPGDSVLLLVADTPSRLPATIVSRCQQLRLPAPPAAVALEWLRAADAELPWPEILDLAGGLPLAARVLVGRGHHREIAGLRDDLDQLARRAVPPTTVAKRWAKLDAEFCLRWLQSQVTGLIRAGLAPPEAGNAPLKNPGTGPNMAACFAYMDRLQQARRLLDRPLNQELQFADLLLWWYGAGETAR